MSLFKKKKKQASVYPKNDVRVLEEMVTDAQTLMNANKKFVLNPSDYVPLYEYAFHMADLVPISGYETSEYTHVRDANMDEMPLWDSTPFKITEPYTFEARIRTDDEEKKWSSLRALGEYIKNQAVNGDENVTKRLFTKE